MDKFFIFIFFLCISGLCIEPQTNIAVIDLLGKGVSTDEASTLTDILRSEIKKNDVFTILERSQVDAVLKEQGFQQSGCTEQSCIVEMGQLIGVERIITGSIGRLGESFIISVRMLDIKTGKILKDENEKFKGKIEDIMDKALPQLAARICSVSDNAAINKIAEPSAETSETDPIITTQANTDPGPTTKKKGILKMVTRIACFTLGTAGVIGAYIYKRDGDKIYDDTYKASSNPNEVERARQDIEKKDLATTWLLIVGGLFYAGGALTFVF